LHALTMPHDDALARLDLPRKHAGPPGLLRGLAQVRRALMSVWPEARGSFAEAGHVYARFRSPRMPAVTRAGLRRGSAARGETAVRACHPAARGIRAQRCRALARPRRGGARRLR